MAIMLPSLQIARYFTTELRHPYNEITWERGDVAITKDDGSTAFAQRDVEFPSFWSQQARTIVASKYFRGPLDAPTRERSVRQMIDRVAGTISRWGKEDGYFADVEEQATFRDELTYLLLHQMASFNSPVWFNIGVNGRPPTASACFIIDVEDDMASILEWYRQEGIIFKGGSGSGVNVSKLRAQGEGMSGGGYASGPLSWMATADRNATSIKSGGVTRRAARMVVMNVDHPDIVQFIWVKVREEEKANALIAAGYDAGLDGEAYATVAHQSANHSVGVTDEFMRLVEEDGDWATFYVTTGGKASTYKARELFRQIAEATHACGDPGMQFHDTMNAWHTTPSRGRIVSSNPCQPGCATVLTPEGIRTFDDIDVGSIIWSGKRWTTVTRKVATGEKPVFEYHTTAGVFLGTNDHRIISHGARVPVGEARTMDIAQGPIPHAEILAEDFDAQAVVDGMVLGDGSAKPLTSTATTPYVLLCVGENDHSYFDEASGVAHLITHDPFDKCFHRVKTTFEYEEMRHTYDRTIPDRFFYATERAKRSFLRGLYSANGSVVDDRVTLKATSFAVITRAQAMLSSLGIASYYTTNPAKDVEFSNGVYACKQSYDLNICADKRLFAALIGFIQPYKQERLRQICLAKPGKNRKTSYAIQRVVPCGTMPVFDITVSDEEHTYWTMGQLVSNCSEYVRPPNEACNLASLNLLRFLSPDGTFDTVTFQHATRLMLTAQEILVSRASYPTEAIARNSEDFRPLGLGYANLGALLMASGIPYDSESGRAYAASITALMTGEAYAQSARLAAVKGAFNGYAENADAMMGVIEKHAGAATAIDADALHDRDTLSAALDAWTQAIELGRTYGYRNAQVSLLAPTGTIRLMMDCTTSGVEPEIALVNYKKLVGGGTLKQVNDVVDCGLDALKVEPTRKADVLDYIATNGSLDHCEYLTERQRAVFDCALPATPGCRTIHWEGHLRMVGAVQPFLSGSVSKTINMPQASTIDDIERAYMLAWKLGCKSVAIYRDGCKQTQPVTTQAPGSDRQDALVRQTLSNGQVREALEQAAVNFPHVIDEWFAETMKETAVFRKHASAHPMPARRRLPDERPALTHKFSLNGHECYVTVGLYPDTGQPGELFLSMAKEGSTISGLMDAFGIVTSLALQSGVPLQALVEKFSHMRFEPSGFTGNRALPIAKSLMDYIFRWLALKFTPQAAPTQEVASDPGRPLAASSLPGAVRETRQTLAASAQVGVVASDAPPCSVCGHLTVRNGTCYLCVVCGTSMGCS